MKCHLSSQMQQFGVPIVLRLHRKMRLCLKIFREKKHFILGYLNIIRMGLIKLMASGEKMNLYCFNICNIFNISVRYNIIV
jgi:hypothetical protein